MGCERQAGALGLFGAYCIQGPFGAQFIWGLFGARLGPIWGPLGPIGAHWGTARHGILGTEILGSGSARPSTDDHCSFHAQALPVLNHLCRSSVVLEMHWRSK